MDKVALITGAGGGLGQALTAEFLRQGWRVVAGWHHRENPERTQRSWSLELDVADRISVERAVEAIGTEWGRIDLLINNAAMTADHPLWQMSETDWDQVLAVNLKGAFHCARAVLPLMLRQREGQMMNIASFAARSGPKGQANYAAAKAGLIGLTQSLAKEVAARNIRVNAILPGVMRTAMTAKLPDAQLGELDAANLLARFNSPAEVARFAVFLATMENISGQIFQLDSRIAPWIRS